MKFFNIQLLFTLLTFLFTGTLQAQTCQSNIGSVSVDRTFAYYDLDGGALSNTLLKLNNPANFGEGGIVDQPNATSHETAEITEALLSQYDLFFIGWIYDFSNYSLTLAELDAMESWVNNGGNMIITSDDPNHDAVAEHFGYPVSNQGSNPYAVEPGQENHPIFDGPFGLINSLNSAQTRGYYANTAGATVLARDVNGNATILEKNVGSGIIVLIGDVCTVGNLTVSFGDGIINNNDIFVGNLFAYLGADCDFDGDGIGDEDDNCPLVANTDQIDTDGDGIGNACDDDDDNDGCLDVVDDNPLVASVDTDGDGDANDCDMDDDDDGIDDVCDSEPLINNFIFTGVNDLPASWTCPTNGNNEKVMMCHIPSGNPANAHVICVSANAVQAHLDHGDMLGDCVSCGSSTYSVNPNGNSGAPNHYGDTELEIFPNPAQDMVDIHLHGTDLINAQIIIYDNLGRVVFQRNLEQDETTLELNLSDNIYKSGVYIVSMISEGQSIAKRLVITK